MRHASASLLLLVLVSSLSPVHGVLEAYNTNLRCRCIHSTGALVQIRQIERIEITPPGNGCPNKEIILWMKNKSVVCLKPQTKWIYSVAKLIK
ncbi:C-X-C motif chemokine 13 [Tupaia chinensis]|uniref:C-X-C motif chemokine 13 n=2 Tax=Tupaia chinensis TaxID=246437 RepID=L9KMG8_TUPCH|nr:C-X-C motif chemokine 13 [Tupaia chinensis]